MVHIRVICEVKDIEPYFLFTAIKNRKKLKEGRVIVYTPGSKWETFLPDNLVKEGRTTSLLIHNGKGDMKEYLVETSRIFASFEDMLYSEGHDTCIPGATFEEALKLYKSFYTDLKIIKNVIVICLTKEIEITKEAVEQYEKEVEKK